MTPAPDRSGPNPSSAPIPWASWVQAGGTAMLAVLFLVIVVKTRQQSSAIRQLEERVQGLENSRALERSTGLDQQLRAAVERLQTVERNGARLDGLSRDVASLRQDLGSLRSASRSTDKPPSQADEPAEPTLQPPLKSPGAAN